MRKIHEESVFVTKATKMRHSAIDNLDIFRTSTLHKLAQPLSGTEFCSHDQVYFETQLRYMVCTSQFPGTLSSSGIENVPETWF